MKKLAAAVGLAILSIFFSAGNLVYAQTGSIKGAVIDSAQNSPLEYASVVLLNSADSSTVGFTFSEPTGGFNFKDLEPGKYIVQMLYAGYAPYSKFVTLAKNESRDLGTIPLSTSSMTLSTAFVNLKAIPVAINGDTLVYNPNAFKTKNNANVEDLLKKLPGVTVNRNGEVIAQGEKVVKVLVNGKEFFGNDPTKATQNLDAGSLEKVEILDKKSDNSEFTGVDDGNREKVINLVLKKEASKGYFGKLEAGGGTEETYALKGTINYFKDENQITAIGNLNNLNQNGFDWQEYYRMLNGANGVSLGQRTYWFSQNQWLGSNEQGRQENAVLGTNAHVKVGKKSELEMSYFVMGRNNKLKTSTTSENYLPEQVILSNSSYNSTSKNGQHKGVFEYNWRPDTLNWIEIGFEGDFSNGVVDGFSLTENLNSENVFLNNSMSKTSDIKFNQNMTSQITWRKKSKKSKNSFVLQAGGEINRAGDTSSWISDYSLNEVEYDPNLPFQFIDKTGGTGDVVYGRGEYNISLDSFRFLSLSADNKMTLGGYEMRRLDLTKDSLFTGQSPNITTNYRVSKVESRFNANLRKKNGWYYSLGLGALNIDVDRELSRADSQRFQQNYWMPMVNFYMSYNKNKKVRFGTWMSTSETFPGTSEINPVANVRNPISITTGNLSLDPYVTYNSGFNFTRQNRAKNRYLHASVYAMYRPNSVVRNQVRDSNNFSRTTYVNDRASSSETARLYYSFLVEKLNLEFGLSAGASRFTYYSVLNDVYYKNASISFDYGIDVTLELDDLEVYLEYDPEYSYQTAGFVSQNPSYWSHNIVAEVVYDVTDRIQVATEYDLYYFNAQQVGQKQLVPLFNAEVSVGLDTVDRWTLTLTGFDMLNQNQSISRNFYSTTYSETRQNTITRFFMVGVRYSIRKGKKKELHRGPRWD